MRTRILCENADVRIGTVRTPANRRLNLFLSQRGEQMGADP